MNIIGLAMGISYGMLARVLPFFKRSEIGASFSELGPGIRLDGPAVARGCHGA